MKNPVPIRDAEGEKFILLLALIFFGMIARYAGDWGLSKEVFPIRKPKIIINVEESKPPGHFTPQNILKKIRQIPNSHSLPDLTPGVLLTDFPARVPGFKWCFEPTFILQNNFPAPFMRSNPEPLVHGNVLVLPEKSDHSLIKNPGAHNPSITP